MWENDVRTFPDACLVGKFPPSPEVPAATACVECSGGQRLPRDPVSRALTLSPARSLSAPSGFSPCWRARPELASGQEGCASGSPAKAAVPPGRRLDFSGQGCWHCGPVGRQVRCFLWRSPSGSRRERRLGF